MGNKKKKKDPAKELAKKQRKAAKQERCADKRDRKAGLADEQQDLAQLIAQQRARDLERTEVTVTKIETEEKFAPRCNATLSCIGDDLYLFGGESSDGDQTTVLNDLYKYRTTKNEWFKVESLNTPSPRCSHQAVSLNDHLYVFGGEYATLTQFYHYRDLWRLDAKTLAWEQVEPCTKVAPSSRSGHRMVEWRGKILVFGGFYKASQDQNAVFVNDTWLYSPAHNEWRPLKFTDAPGVAKPPLRSGCVLAPCSDFSVLVWGGYSEIRCDNAVKARGKPHTDCWELKIADPFDENSTLSSWSRVKLGGSIGGSAPSPRCGVCASYRNDTTHVFGGVYDVDGEGLSTESTFYDDHYVLDTTKKRWKRRDALQDPDLPPPPPRAWDRKALQASLVAVSLTPPPRIGACCAVAGKVLYVLGGTLEVGDTKELALDDVWCRDARKKDAPWTRLVSGTMSKRSAHWAAEESDKSDDEDEEEDLGSTSSDSDETAGEEEEVKRDQWTR